MEKEKDTKSGNVHCTGHVCLKAVVLFESPEVDMVKPKWLKEIKKREREQKSHCRQGMCACKL